MKNRISNPHGETHLHLLTFRDCRPTRGELLHELHTARTWQVVWILVAVCGWITALATMWVR